MGGSRFLRWAGSTMGRSCKLAVAILLTADTALDLLLRSHGEHFNLLQGHCWR